jgi:hypothetical protein
MWHVVLSSDAYRELRRAAWVLKQIWGWGT